MASSTRYLNHELRKDIRGLVKEHVEKLSAKSAVGKRLAREAKRLGERLHKFLIVHFPGEDMAILQKYKVSRGHSGFSFGFDSNDKLVSPGRFGRTEELILPLGDLITPDHVDGYDLVKLVEAQFPDIHAALAEHYREAKVFECENGRLVSAYMARVYRFRTVDSLLKAHPEMAQFIPDEDKPAPALSHPETEKLIAAFEKKAV